METLTLADGRRVTITLQWGHGLGAVETVDIHATFRTELKLQWGHGLGAVETDGIARKAHRRKGFNGATAWEPWRPLPFRRQRVIDGLASMGPRLGSRGDGLPSTLLGYPVIVLQWGHGLGAVETSAIQSTTCFTNLLQWGHGLGAVETHDMSDWTPSQAGASMGPRLGSRGDG